MITTILLTGGGLAALLTSCQNFLNGKEIKDEIEEVIDYANAPSYKILVQAEDEYGTVKKPADGELVQKATDTFEIKFSPAADHSFVRWEASSVNLPEGESIYDYVSFEDVANPETRVTFKKGLDSLVIKAFCPHLPYTEFSITGSKDGKYSPAKGTYICTESYSYPLSFDPDTDFEFIRWQIFDPRTEEEIPNGTYIKIEDPDSSSTSYSLASVPLDSELSLSVKPIVAERPQIISNFPSTSGMLKDSVVQVLFDSDMDPFSIYYTEDEIVQMKDSGVPDENFLPKIDETNPIDSNNHYGYKDASGEIFFKNITMTNKKTKQNLTGCFGAPVFENASTLSIPVNGKDALPGYTQVLVTIGRGFFYRKDEKIVAMAGSKKWMYQVNDKTDTKPLIVSKTGSADDFTAKISESDANAISQEASHTITTSGGGSGINTLNFIKENKLYLDLHVQEPEAGSGPKSYFTIMLKRIYGKNYVHVPSSEKEKTVLVDFQNVTADDAVIDGYVDLNDLYDADSGEKLTLEDGVYAMSFMFEDNSGNQFTYPADGKKYYFAKDTTPPDIAMPTMISSNSANYTISWLEFYDVKLAQVTYGETDSVPNVSDPIEKNTRSFGIADILPNKSYDVKVKFTDYAGNEIEKTIPKFLTGYYMEGTLDFTRTNASHASNVFFAGDKMSDYGVNSIKIAWSDGTVEDVISSGYTIPNGPNNNGVYNSDWKIFYKKEGEIDKYAAPGSYYIAQKDSLTQTPKFWQESNSWYCKFGDYPQKLSGYTDASSFTAEKVYNGWYIGENGYFYEKCHTNIAGNATTTAGGTLPNDKDCYFRVQPIEWRYACGDYKGKRLLIARKNLDGVKYYTSTSNRTVNGGTIKPNNYKYSTLRAFLNGKYESGDSANSSYNNNGFLQKAFTPNAQSLIYESAVDNSAVTTNPKNEPNKWGGGVNANTCDTTYDKVFALSVQEATNTDFGFAYQHDWAHYGWRLIHTTDYAKAKHVYESTSGDNTGTSNTYASIYWLRSPSRSSNETGSARIVDTEGAIKDRSVTADNSGVVPAILLQDGV